MSSPKGKAKAPIEVITIDDDSDDEVVVAPGEDEEMERATAMSLASARAEGVKLPPKSAVAPASNRAVNAIPVREAAPGGSNASASESGSGFGGGNESRAELERQRQERVRKREADGLSNAPAYATRPAVKRPRVGTISDIPDEPSTSSSSSSSAFGARAPFGSSTGQSFSAGRDQASDERRQERFWTGAIKRVSNDAVPTVSDSFAFHEIVPARSVHMAIAGAFNFDIEWLLKQFPTNAPLLLVTAHDGTTPPGQLDTVAGRDKTHRVMAPDCKDQFPSAQNQYFTMHVKIVVLYYDAFCRVIIPTANLVEFDWNIIENLFYVQDFPTYTPDPALRSPRLNPHHSPFSSALLEYLHHLSVPKQFLFPFRGYDFSASKDSVRLVQTSQGVWDGWEAMEKGGGMCSLASAVESLGFGRGGQWEIELATSSLGSYPTTWLAQFLAACSGIHPKTYYSSTTPTNLKKGQDSNKLPIKFVFPTLAEVDSSILGRAGGQTIFCRQKPWESTTFPRDLFHKFHSKRRGVLSHSKTIVAIRKKTAKDGPNFEYVAWVYVGSHNATGSAWGLIQTTKATKLPKGVNKNYEMGVIVPVRGTSEEDIERKVSELVCYKRPLERYGGGDVPWMSEIHK